MHPKQYRTWDGDGGGQEGMKVLGGGTQETQRDDLTATQKCRNWWSIDENLQNGKNLLTLIWKHAKPPKQQRKKGTQQRSTRQPRSYRGMIAASFKTKHPLFVPNTTTLAKTKNQSTHLARGRTGDVGEEVVGVGERGKCTGMDWGWWLNMDFWSFWNQETAELEMVFENDLGNAEPPTKRTKKWWKIFVRVLRKPVAENPICDPDRLIDPPPPHHTKPTTTPNPIHTKTFAKILIPGGGRARGRCWGEGGRRKKEQGKHTGMNSWIDHCI